MNNMTAGAVSAFIYLVLFLGFGLLLRNNIVSLILKLKMRKRLKCRKRALRPQGRLEKHLSMLLQITLGGRIGVGGFCLASLGLFGVTAFTGTKSYPIWTAGFVGMIITLLPVLFLEIRLESIRRKGSFEGESFVGNFLSKYRMAGLNVYEAMEMTVEDRKNNKICSQFLYTMLVALRNTADGEEIKKITEEFAAAINTNWSRMLAYNIRMGALKGTNISAAVEDILLQLRAARTLAEERKRINSEASRMVMFLIPIMYLATVFMSVRYIGMSSLEFLRNQFLTETGFLLFLVSIFLYLANMALIEAVNHQKFDF